MTPPIETGGVQPGTSNLGRPQADRSSTQRSAEDLRKQATAEAGARADELRESTAHKADTLADSVEAAARELSNDDIGHMSEYVSDLAEQLRNVSGTLRDKSGDELLHDVGRLAREKPAVFLAGAVAIGFGLGRFARSSQRPHRNERDQLPVRADEATAHGHDHTSAHMQRAGASGTTRTATPGVPSAATSAAGTSRPHTGTPPNTGVAGSTLGTGAATPGSTTGGTSS